MNYNRYKFYKYLYLGLTLLFIIVHKIWEIVDMLAPNHEFC